MSAALTWRSGRTLASARPQIPLVALRASPLQELKEGLRHVWHTPHLRAAMALAALVNLCAFPLSGGLMPYIARDVFGQDQQGLGWLVASYATGALLGSLAMGAFGGRLPPSRTMLVTCGLWYLILLVWRQELWARLSALTQGGYATTP